MHMHHRAAPGLHARASSSSGGSIMHMRPRAAHRAVWGRRARLGQKIELIEDWAQDHATADAEHASGDSANGDNAAIFPHFLSVPLHIAVSVLVSACHAPLVAADQSSPSDIRE